MGASKVENLGIKTLDQLKKGALTFLTLILVLTIGSCASKAPKYEKVEELKRNQEFEQTVKIVVPAETAHDGSDVSAPAQTTTTSMATTTTLPGKKADKKIKKPKKGELPPPPAPVGRQPDIESTDGFDGGRRPLKDPFRVGERVTHNVSYFKVSAGILNLESRAYAEVNGHKNYQFRTSIKTSSLFSSFYSVDDYVDVLMDFDQMIPSVFTQHVKETDQLKEAQMYFDHEKNTATFWEKKVTEKNGEETKKQHWEIMPYSQSVFSAAFYMRIFQWEVGKEYAFRVANDNENLVFRAKALRREKISTKAGDFDAVVIKPEIELKGKFKPVGDIFIWLSDDDRKYLLRIESQIKIGTLVSEVIEIIPGKP